MNNIEKFQRAAYSLIQNDRYYGNLLLECRTILDYPMKHRAAVTSRGGQPVLLFSAQALQEHNVRQICGMIKHELMHIILDHLKVNTVSADGFWDDSTARNIAQDCMINQDIYELHDTSRVTVEDLSKTLGVELDRYQTSQYYFEQMMAQIKDKRDELKKLAEQAFDDHNFEDPMADGDFQKQAGFFNAMRRAANKSAGNIPQEVMEALDAIQGQMETPWQALLANFVARQISQTRIPTRKKLNRRYAHLTPGHKKERELCLALCIDESGSMSEEWLGKIYDQIQQLLTSQGLLHIIHADCEVAAVETLKKGDRFNFVRRSNGGTAYDPAIKKAVELNVDAIIYFGDMDTADTPEDPGIPVLWITTSNNITKPGNFGEMVRLR
jgi:predicted metal-dependent peptidase